MESRPGLTLVTVLTPDDTTAAPSTSLPTASDPSPSSLLSPTSASAPFAPILSIPPLLDTLSLDCQAYAVAHGLTMYNKAGHLIHAPLTLLPAPFPRECYELALSLATDYNLLYDAIGRDYDFLVQTLTLSVPQSTQPLWAIGGISRVEKSLMCASVVLSRRIAGRALPMSS